MQPPLRKPGLRALSPSFVAGWILLLCAFPGTAGGQSVSDDAVDNLQQQIDELRAAFGEARAEKDLDNRLDELQRQLEILAEEIEKMRLGEAAEDTMESSYGLGVSASKVYRVAQGLSIGGYGEMLYESFSGTREDGSPSGKKDQADLLRGVLYFGYKFGTNDNGNDRWVFNSELEFEHGSTGAAGSASVEFAYLDYLWKPEINLRTGLVLLPMGLLNELHEPPLYLSAERPNVEKNIIPSTWRENGIGIFGDLGPFSYRTYLVSGLRGEKFSSSGVRGGRQKGSKAVAEDFAWTGRLDYTARPGLLVGVSAYIGDSGQGLLDTSGQIIDARTEIFDFHFDWSHRGLRLRGLFAQAEIGDVTRLNDTLGKTGSASIGEQLEGYYLELGYDVLAHRGGRSSLFPFLRMESLDTQSSVPAGFSKSGNHDADILTYGLAFRPIDHLVFKLDYQDWSTAAASGVDQWNLAMGYLF